MMYLWATHEKKCKKNLFFCILKINEERSPDPLVRSTDPGIRIRTNMSRIPNTAKDYVRSLVIL
jgi:hypothetical protein